VVNSGNNLSNTNMVNGNKNLQIIYMFNGDLCFFLDEVWVLIDGDRDVRHLHWHWSRLDYMGGSRLFAWIERLQLESQL